MEKRRSRESEKQEQEGREEWGTPKLFGVIAVRSRFSPFLPVHNLLLVSRLFLFLLLLAVLSTLSSKVWPPPCFSSSACTPTALYACKQPSRVRIEKEKKKKRRTAIKGGT